MATIDALLQLQRLMAPGRRLPTVPYGIGQQGLPYEEGEAMPPPNALAHLPEAVQRSLRIMPSYGEGQTIPPQRDPWSMYRDFAPDANLHRNDYLQRERLSRELDYMAEPKQYPTREGFPLTAPDRYSRPYNLGLGNLGALY